MARAITLPAMERHHSRCAALLILAVSAASCAVDPEVRVTTPDGVLVGTSADGVARFLGIPYAAPPLGALRFAPARPASPWLGERDASESGPACPQIEDGTYRGDEDCLTLDVWTPEDAPSGSELLPVMVWIHGGSLLTGATGDPEHDASALVREGRVVVVEVNYRLGALGFLASSALRDERGDGVLGNEGVRDQLRALEWVRSSIRAFGGDPSRVTLFGESAGAACIRALAAVPAADGLYRSLILQSAPASYGLPTADAAIAHDRALIDALGCTDPSNELACLRALPAERVVRGLAALGDGATLGGAGSVALVVDGAFLPTQPIARVAGGVRWIVGTNREEAGVLATLPVATPALYEVFVREILGEAADVVLAIYPASDFPRPIDALVALLTETQFTCPAALESATSAVDEEVYGYRITHRLSGDAAALGAYHAMDVPLLFGTLDRAGGDVLDGYVPTSDDEVAGRLLRHAWSEFAHGRSPDARWPRFEAGRITELGTSVTTVDDPTAARCAALRAAGLSP